MFKITSENLPISQALFCCDQKKAAFTVPALLQPTLHIGGKGLEHDPCLHLLNCGDEKSAKMGGRKRPLGV
jgi:hypothetical protein